MAKVDQEKLRQVVNKRVSPSDLLIEELNIETTAGGNYAYLNESIYGALADNFLGIFTVDYESSVITFENPVTESLYAKYYGGGSIIWADDINNLNDAVKIIDNNAVYSDGSVLMQGNLNLNTHALTNVTTVNNIDINTHKHNGIDGTPQIETDGIADLAITNEKLSTKEDDGIAAVGTINIQNDAVTNAEIADNTIQNIKLKDNTIQNGKIKDSTIENAKLKDNTIENSKLKDNTIGFSKLNSNDILINIFTVMYPVGSVYITTSSTCPISNYIGTWELVSSGRVLQGSDSNHNAGTTIEAGLPNITGGLSFSRSSLSSSGAFSSVSPTTRSLPSGNSSFLSGSYGCSFSASSSNSIYGKSDTVQPPAYVVNIFKRVS